MKCPNCGMEILGSMKKCPRCAFDTTTGSIDIKYMDAISKEREKRGTPQLRQIVKSTGMYSEDGKKGITCEIELIDEITLRILESKDNNGDRRATKPAFGLLGALVYDSYHGDERKELLAISISDIQEAKRLGIGQNVNFSDGWSFLTSNGTGFLLSMDHKMQKSLKAILGQRMK